MIKTNFWELFLAKLELILSARAFYLAISKKPPDSSRKKTSRILYFEIRKKKYKHSIYLSARVTSPAAGYKKALKIWRKKASDKAAAALFPSCTLEG